jgi:predicted phosphoribosyltransferase
MVFNNISNKFQLKLKDRESAGKILAELLKSRIKKEERKDSLVLGIPRGGVITAGVIAKKLHCELDIIIPKKLTAPYNEELAIGAIMADGSTYLNELVKQLSLPIEYIKKEKLRQLEEIKRRNSSYPSDKTHLDLEKFNFDKKTIILVDDGAATGATVIVAVRWIKANTNPHRFILAIPIIPKNTLNLLKLEDIDNIEVILRPDFNFKSIEQYYNNFNQITDAQVIETLTNYRK